MKVGSFLLPQRVTMNEPESRMHLMFQLEIPKRTLPKISDKAQAGYWPGRVLPHSTSFSLSPFSLSSLSKNGGWW